MRRQIFAEGEYYHVYNRGVDHRSITMDRRDSDRFVLGLRLFNSKQQIGSIAEFNRLAESDKLFPDDMDRIVDLVCYCLNPNHFHMILHEISTGGISQYMKRVSGGYSRYFNLKHKRTGTLFEGNFKAKHIGDNNYLLHVSSYVNLNDKVHNSGHQVTDVVRSSWDEYCGIEGFCQKNGILEQFSSNKEYKNFSLRNLPDMKAIRKDYSELKDILLEKL